MNLQNFSKQLSNTRELKSVVVLTTNQQKYSNFLYKLGVDYNSERVRYMCRMPTDDDARVFRFEVFHLSNSSTKISNFVQNHQDGLIIIIDNMNPEISQQIKTQVKYNSNKPILLYSEKINLKTLPIWFNNSSNLRYFSENDDDNAKEWFYEKLKNTEQRQQNITHTSHTIPINDLVLQFENTILPLDLWDHFGRLRIVFFYLCREGLKALEPDSVLCTKWKKYKTSIGHGKLWHYSLTRFWGLLLWKLYQQNSNKTFEEIYNNTSAIHQGKIFLQYYSEKRIFSQKARDQWVAPDLKSL